MAGNKTILLILLLYIILVEYALYVSAVYFRQLHTARMVGKWPWNGPDWAMQARSKIQCGSFCSQRSECNVAVWKPDSGDCNMYKSLNLHFESVQAGATTETILIANALLVAMVSESGAWYSYDNGHASIACQDLGGRLITYSEMYQAYTEGWLHIGACSHISNGYGYYVLQTLVPGTGFQGVNYCSWDTNWNAYCYIPGFS